MAALLLAAGCSMSVSEDENTTPETPDLVIDTPQDAAPETQAPGDETVAQENARKKAEDYLDILAFSRSGLIEQLEFEGFSTEDATYGVDALDVDWNEQAIKKAAEYMDTSAFSNAGLIEQLEFEGFTPEQAAVGAASVFGGDPAPNAPADEPAPNGDETVSQANAREKAESYLLYSAFSRTGLIKQLEFEGFSTEDATYGVDALDVDWNEQAAKSAAAYLDYSSFSRAGLIEQLIFEGFTQQQAEYGVSKTGL